MKKRILSLLLAVVMLVGLLPHVTIKADAHSIVMTAEEFIDCLWTAYNRPNYYYNSFPYNLGYYDGSRISFDCWNLGKAIIWSKGAIVNNYTKGTYAPMDSSCGLGDWDGLTIVRQDPNCNGDFSELVPGEWLYMDNHTGYYVGDGQVIECTAGWNVWAITVSQIDRYGNRSRNGVGGGSWKLHGKVPWLDYSASSDDEKPVISDVQYTNVSASGYTISCKVTDNRSVKRVAFPTWTVHKGQDDLAANFMATQQGTKNGDTYTFRVNASDHNNESGQYVTHIYAEDRSGNVTSLALSAVDVRNDTQNPVITDVTYTNLSASGYTVSCKVTDDWGVHSVAFPTWTVANGQDDLPEQFFTTQVGAKNGDTYTFRVNASAHNNEGGVYTTHIYATDCAGNRISVAVPDVQVTNDTQKPVISEAEIYDVTAQGYFVRCKVTDNLGVERVAFPTWTHNQGQDDLAENFMSTQRGTKNGDYYTFQVKISDHNNEEGYYTTHIYALDHAGNEVKVELDPVTVRDKPNTITLVSASDYTMDGTFLMDVMPQTSVDALLTQFENEELVILNRDGQVLSGAEPVGTGATVNLYEGNTVIDSLTVVVIGDIDGDGCVDNTDYLRIKAAFYGTFRLDQAESIAADVDANGALDNTDYMRIRSHFLKTFRLYG